MKKNSLFFRVISCVVALAAVACLLVFTPAPTPVSDIMEDTGIETSLPVSAAVSFPFLSESSYCETISPKKVNVFKDPALETRGTYKPSKAYQAYIDKGDVLFLYEITSSYIKVNYPVGKNERRVGYIARSELIGVSSPTFASKAGGKATTYISPGGKAYGYFEGGDQVYAVGKSGSYTAVIYTAKSGKGRAFKLGWANTDDYNRYCKGSSGGSSNNSGQSGGEAVYNKAKSFVGMTYPEFEALGFHFRAWCADFISYCASLAGQSKAVPKNSTVAGMREAVKAAGGKEYSKSKVRNGSYVPRKGDLIVFKSDGASHIGVINYAQDGYIYYIDGNNTSNGNGKKACVHNSKCSVNDSRFTCVLHPNYK